MRTLNDLYDMYPDDDFLRMEGFDDAILGVEEKTKRLVYSKSKIMRQLIRSMDYETAMDYFYQNIEGAWVGDKTPIFVNDMFYSSGI